MEITIEWEGISAIIKIIIIFSLIFIFGFVIGKNIKQQINNEKTTTYITLLALYWFWAEDLCA